MRVTVEPPSAVSCPWPKNLPWPVPEHTFWTRRARLIQVVDADTIWAEVNQGGAKPMFAHWDIRLQGYDAAHKDSPRGRIATARVAELLTPAPFVLVTEKDRDEKWGRLLGRITLLDGRDLATILLTENLVVPWDGTGGHPDQPGHE